jgi:hypothetical protein
MLVLNPVHYCILAASLFFAPRIEHHGQRCTDVVQRLACNAQQFTETPLNTDAKPLGMVIAIIGLSVGDKRSQNDVSE